MKALKITIDSTDLIDICELVSAFSPFDIEKRMEIIEKFTKTLLEKIKEISGCERAEIILEDNDFSITPYMDAMAVSLNWRSDNPIYGMIDIKSGMGAAATKAKQALKKILDQIVEKDPLYVV